MKAAPLLATLALAMATHPSLSAPNERPALGGANAVRVSNYGAPSRLVQERSEVERLVGEIGELRKKPWRRGDTKMRCYATVVVLDGNKQLALFRVRPEQIVERPVEKGGSSYSAKLAEGDLPALRKLLGEIPVGPKCD